MTFAIQLFLDPVSDTAVRSVWEELANTGLSHMRDSGNRPHISLALYRELDVSVCASLLTSFAQMHAPFSITFESLGIFHAEKTVVFLAPIISSHLLDVHREVHELLQGTGAYPTLYYLPGHWTPHCALATRVPPHLLSQVIDIGLGVSFPLTFSIEEIGVIEYPPVKHLFAFRLTGA
jgi:2'-5' RNA ligase